MSNNILSMSMIQEYAQRAGSYFFSPSTMDFFNSRILSGTYRVEHETVEGSKIPRATYLFVTSERFSDDAPRLYSVRRFKVEPVEPTESNNYARLSVEIDALGERFSYAATAKRDAERRAESGDVLTEWEEMHAARLEEMGA